MTDNLPAGRTAALLRAHGYDVPDHDGYDDRLRDAIRAYQADAGLTDSGNVTKKTADTLEARPELSVGDSAPQVRLFQHSLNGRGHRLRVTGVFGPAERDALQEYQGQVGITRSGVVDEETWEALGWPTAK